MKKIIAVACIAISMFSCKKSEDNEAPVIQFVRVNGVVADEHHLDAGTIMNVEVRMTDNIELNQVKVNIHPADDGHSHSTGGGGATEPNTGIWTGTRILNLSGTEATRSVQFPIPDDVAGYWHLEVMLIDRAGNQAQIYVTTLHVENDNLPQIVVTTNPPIVNDEVELEPGDNLEVSGEVTDSDGLALVQIEVEDEANNVIFEQEFTPSGETAFQFGPLSIPFPDDGHFHLHVKAQDINGLVRETEVHIHVH